MESKTLNDRAKEAVVTCMEHSQAEPTAVAELGKAFAAIIETEAKQSAMSISTELIDEIKNL